MADTLADALLEPGARIEPADRGWLQIDERVTTRVAELAALDVPGVVRQSGALGAVTGRSLPRADVVVAGGRARVSMDIAVSWPHPLAGTAAAVRDRVAGQLQALTSITADAVDVSITHVVQETAPQRMRRVQ